MELILTKEQKQYLDKKGLLNATELQETYKKSVRPTGFDQKSRRNPQKTGLI